MAYCLLSHKEFLANWRIIEYGQRFTSVVDRSKIGERSLEEGGSTELNYIGNTKKLKVKSCETHTL
jgi:hypothetical protein